MSEQWYKFSMGREQEPPAFFLDEFDFHGVDWIDDLQNARPVANWRPDCCLWSTGPEWDGPLTDTLQSSCHLPIFSARLLDALDEAGIARQDIQYLPVRIRRYTGEEFEGYVIANILASVRALDFEHSMMVGSRGRVIPMDEEPTFDPETGERSADGLVRPALKKEPLVGHDVIRLYEHMSFIMVSPRFAKVFHELGCNGGTELRPVPVY